MNLRSISVKSEVFRKKINKFINRSKEFTSPINVIKLLFLEPGK